MGTNPSHNKGDYNPVENVSWEEAMAFCRKITERERNAGRLLKGYEYTLPPMWEWEYACRAGTTTLFAGNGNLDDMGWYDKNSDGHTHPVGRKMANAWGLYDMHGNVWEWTLGYNDYAGGAYWNSFDRCRSFDSDGWMHTIYRNEHIGFRVALFCPPSKASDD